MRAAVYRHRPDDGVVRVLPDGWATLVFHRGRAPDASGASIGSRDGVVVVQPGLRPVTIDHRGADGEYLIIQTDPITGSRLLAAAAGWGRSGGGSARCLHTLAERLIETAQHLLVERCRTSAETRARAGCRELRSEAGRLTCQGLATRLGCDERTLRRSMGQRVGLSPKAYARCVRLERAATLLRSPRLDQSRIALEAGYCDQAHMAREFAALGGVTPRRVRSDRDVW